MNKRTHHKPASFIIILFFNFKLSLMLILLLLELVYDENSFRVKVELFLWSI